MKYEYLWTNKYDENEPNNGYLPESETTEDFGIGYTFADWLRDNDVNYDVVNSTDTEFIVVDDEGDPTDDRYLIIGREPSAADILASTGMTRHDVEKHINDGVTIYEVVDYLIDFDENTAELDEDSKEELRAFLEAGKDGKLWDNDLTTFDGIKYYIEYCL